MKSSEIRGLSIEAIRARLIDSKDELMKLRFQQATGELTDFTRLRYTRRLIARMFTVLQEREQATAKEGEA